MVDLLCLLFKTNINKEGVFISWETPLKIKIGSCSAELRIVNRGDKVHYGANICSSLGGYGWAPMQFVYFNSYRQVIISFTTQAIQYLEDQLKRQLPKNGKKDCKNLIQELRTFREKELKI